MSPAASARAWAKINLHLGISHRRHDGYHEIRTVMQTVTVGDTLRLELPGSGEGIEIRCDDPAVPTGAENTITRSFDALFTLRPDLRQPVVVHLEKQVPAGSGLGAGSSDAACALTLFASMVSRPPSEDEGMEALAAAGSDTAFFLCGGRALCVGRGEEVFPLPDLPVLHGILAVPRGVSVSTARAYEGATRGLTVPRPDRTLLAGLARERDGASALEILAAWDNQFGKPVLSSYPALPEMASALSATGPALVRLTGSGAAQYAIYPGGDERDQALRQLEETCEEAWIRPFESLDRESFRSEVAPWPWKSHR